MWNDYPDIRILTDQEPAWYDSNGTPRFAPFVTSLCPDIYADVVVLMEIECQRCGKRFLVQMASSFFDHSSRKIPRNWHYGDPPRHGSCAGNTMNCVDISVIEVWSKQNTVREWRRLFNLEGPIEEAGGMP